MLDHLIDPDIPTKRQEIKYDIREKLEQIGRCENEIASLQDEMRCAQVELDELRKEFWKFAPDPDAYYNEPNPDTKGE